MRNNWLIGLTITLILFGTSCEPNKQTVVDSLMNKLDSLDQIMTCKEPDCRNANKLRRLIADSLYTLDSTNYTSIVVKAVQLHNDGMVEESLNFFNKVLSHDSINLVQRGMALSVFGRYWESLDVVDSAHFYYEQLLPIFDKSTFSPWMEPQIITILKGKEAGLVALENSETDTTGLYYYYLKNDILNYDNEGLHIFFPTYVDEDDLNSFWVFIPEELYESGQLNSMEKVSLYYAKKGVNIHVNGHYSSNRKFEIRTIDKFLEPLRQLNVFDMKLKSEDKATP